MLGTFPESAHRALEEIIEEGMNRREFLKHILELGIAIYSLSHLIEAYAEDNSDEGIIAFYSTRSIPPGEACGTFIMNPDGSDVRQVINPYLKMRLFHDFSSDGKWYLTTKPSPENPAIWEIYLVEFGKSSWGRKEIRLTNSPILKTRPAWSHDKKKIAYCGREKGKEVDYIWVMNADGSDPHKLTEGSDPSWSYDDKKIVFCRDLPGPGTGIFIMNPDGSDIRQISQRPCNDRSPCFSPDGKKIAFTYYPEEEVPEIYIMNIDGSNRINLTKHAARDFTPRWHPSSILEFEVEPKGKKYTLWGDLKTHQ